MTTPIGAPAGPPLPEMPAVELAILAGGTLVALIFTIRWLVRPDRRGVFRLPLGGPALDAGEQSAVAADELAHRVGGAAASLSLLHVAAPVFCLIYAPVLVRRLFWPAADAASAPAGDAAGVVVMAATQAVTAAVALGCGLHAFGDARRWGLRIGRVGRTAGAALLSYLAVWPVIVGLEYVSRATATALVPDYVPPEHDAIVFLLDPASPAAARGLAVVSAAAFAPLMEELLFRGLLQRFLTQVTRSPWTGVIGSAALFGLIHFNVPTHVAPLTFFGVVLGYGYARSGSLTFAILLHALFNVKTLLFVLLLAE